MSAVEATEFERRLQRAGVDAMGFAARLGKKLLSAGSAPCVLRDGRCRGLLRMRNFLNAIKGLPSS